MRVNKEDIKMKKLEKHIDEVINLLKKARPARCKNQVLKESKHE